MLRSNADKAADVIAAVTLGMGAALASAPGRVGRGLGLGDRIGVARALGVVDIVLVPGLIRAQPRWPWVGARASLNVVIAGVYLQEARQSSSRMARAGVAAMISVAVIDGLVAARLRSADDILAREARPTVAEVLDRAARQSERATTSASEAPDAARADREDQLRGRSA